MPGLFGVLNNNPIRGEQVFRSLPHSTLDSSWMWPKLLRLSTLLLVDVSPFYMPNDFLNVLSTVSMKSYKLNTFLKDNVSRDVSYFSHLASKNIALREQVPILRDFTLFLFCFMYIYILFYLQITYFHLPLHRTLKCMLFCQLIFVRF